MSVASPYLVPRYSPGPLVVVLGVGKETVNSNTIISFSPTEKEEDCIFGLVPVKVSTPLLRATVPPKDQSVVVFVSQGLLIILCILEVSMDTIPFLLILNESS